MLKRFKIFVFDIKVALKPLPEDFPMTNVTFENFSMPYLNFPQNGFNFVIKNLLKTEKCQLQRFRTFGFQLNEASKQFFKTLAMTKFEFIQL